MRFQVKKARRRSGQTDYKQRKGLSVQHKCKYNSPKYRLVVRKTNTRIICQVIYATLQGDQVLAHADSSELPRYGLKVGLKNYPAAYCTGLLVGRRLLKKVGLDDVYTGVGNEDEDEVDGEIMSTEFNKRKYFVDELNEDRRPFRCFLDVGLARTTLGAKIFGAMKGAADAGLDIPHNYKKFPGYSKPDTKEEKPSYDPALHRDIIFGTALSEYMTVLKEEDEQTGGTHYAERFSQYVKNEIEPDGLEDLYKAVHKAIRADPSPAHKESHKVRHDKKKWDVKKKRMVKKTKEQRDADVAVKRAKILAITGNTGSAVSDGEDEKDGDDDDDDVEDDE
jgi:large subunit ribosomal protein L5e